MTRQQRVRKIVDLRVEIANKVDTRGRRSDLRRELAKLMLAELRSDIRADKRKEAA